MLFTVGHSNHPLDTFLALLRDVGITAIADVRSSPYSRFNPQYNREALELSLCDAGIGYAHMRALGGLRHPRKDSPNTGWRNESFPRRYNQFRAELGQDISEDVAGRALERAIEADEAAHVYLQAAVDNIDKVSPTHLAKNAAALLQGAGQSVQTAQLLRDRPTVIVETRSLGELVGTLEKLGVAERDENVIDVEILGEEDA